MPVFTVLTNNTTMANTVGGTAPAATWPTGLQAGDCAIIQAMVRNDAAGTLSAPSGWTQVGSTVTEGNHKAYIFKKDAELTGGESGTVTVPQTGSGGRRCAIIHVFRAAGQGWSTEGFGSHTSAASTTVTDQSVTSTSSSRLALNFIYYADQNETSAQETFSGTTGGTWVKGKWATTGLVPAFSLEYCELASAGTIDGGSATVDSTAQLVLGVALYRTSTDLPDLQVTDIAWDPAAPIVGQNVTLTASVKNIGLLATPAATVHRVKFSIGGVQIAVSTSRTTSIAINETVVVTADAAWVPGAALDAATIAAEVNDTQIISESDYTNNTRTESITVVERPNLVVTDVIFTPVTPGQPVSLSCKVKNIGASPTPSGTNIEVRFDVNGQQVALGVPSTAVIGVNEEITINAATSWVPDFFIKATVDYNDLIDESNEADNFLEEQVVQAAACDLVVTAIDWLPASPNLGEAITLSATIRNQGSAASPDIVHRVRWTVGGVMIAESTSRVTGIAVDAEVAVQADAGWTPGSAGDYVVVATVDPLNTIVEINKSNNTLQDTVTVVATGPDLVITDITWNHTLVNEAITFGAVFSNIGSTATEAGVHIIDFTVEGNLVSRSTTHVSALAAGGSTDASAGTTWTPSTAGSYTVTATINPGSTLTETNYTNNSRTEFAVISDVAPSGLMTFNGRSDPNVTPQESDYSAFFYTKASADSIFQTIASALRTFNGRSPDVNGNISPQASDYDGFFLTAAEGDGRYLTPTVAASQGMPVIESSPYSGGATPPSPVSHGTGNITLRNPVTSADFAQRRTNTSGSQVTVNMPAGYTLASGSTLIDAGDTAVYWKIAGAQQFIR